MSRSSEEGDRPVVLVTGGARRIGAQIVKTLHGAGFNVVLHYRHSETEASQLAAELNGQREKSVFCVQTNLCDLDSIATLAKSTLEKWQRLDALINNASSFYSTPVGEFSSESWDDLIGTNLKAPLFLSQHLAAALSASNGSIVNIADIHAERPLSEHTIYCIAKAGNIMMTKSLAKELAPNVRVNGISPGAILWPEKDSSLDEKTKNIILEKVALQKTGSPNDIANTIKFLLTDAPYITGQILAVDGGRSLVS